jgi:cell division septation protein DedD
VGHTVVLADRWEASTVISALSVDADVMAYLAPPEAATPESAPAEEPAAAEPEVDLELPLAAPRMDDVDFNKIRIPKDSAREALIADLRARQRAALQAPPPAIAPLPEEVDIPRERPVAPLRSSGFPPAKPSINEPGFASTVREKPRRRVMLPALLVVLLVSSAAAGWHYWSGGSIAGFERIEPQSAQAPTRPSSQAPTPPAEPPMPAGRPLPYSVAIAGYQLLDQAQERVDQLRNESSMQFFIAPTVVQGALFYRVLAGPLPDSTTAAAVRDTLVARRIKTMTLASDLLAAPYSFLIGTFARRNEAQARAAEAAAKGIPAYIVPVGDPAGATTYRVYAGAYSGQGDAEFLREILKSAALPDSLVERTGSIRS